MPNFHDKWRSWSTLTESQLLSEGRKEDAAKKYPEVAQKRVELDGDNLLDILIAADPSGNQKYLMNAARLVYQAMEMADRDGLKPWWGKITAYMPDNNEEGEGLYSPYGITGHIANLLPKYHKLMPYITGADDMFRDMGNILTWQAFKGVVAVALQKKNRAEKEKEEKKRLAKEARDESRVIEANDYHIIRRPESQVASCYYGQGTTWCVAATKSENYWDHYKQKGRSFYFITTRRNDVDSDWKIMTLVYGPDGELDEDEPIKSASNDTMDADDFEAAIRQGILGSDVGGEIASLDVGEPYNKKLIVDTLSAFPSMREDAYQDYVDEGLSEEDALERLVEMFRDRVVVPYIEEIYRKTKEDVEENPVEAFSEEDFERIKEEVELEHAEIDIYFDDDYVNWSASYTFDVSNIIGGHKSPGEQVTYAVNPDLNGEEYIEAIEHVFDAMRLPIASEWREEAIRQSDDPEEFTVAIDVGAGDYTPGTLSEFQDFVHNVEYVEGSFPDFEGELYKYMLEKGLIKRDKQSEKYWPDPAEKERQMDLPLQEGRLIKIKIMRRK